MPRTHLKTARWVCSCSSPLIMQENNPKDSAPGEEGRGARCSFEGSAPHTGKDKTLSSRLTASAQVVLTWPSLTLDKKNNQLDNSSYPCLQLTRLFQPTPP